MAMSAASMKIKIKEAYTARTGQSMPDDPRWGVLIDICTGVISEITSHAVININYKDSTYVNSLNPSVDTDRIGTGTIV